MIIVRCHHGRTNICDEFVGLGEDIKSNFNSIRPLDPKKARSRSCPNSKRNCEYEVLNVLVLIFRNSYLLFKFR